ncbi:MAG: ATP synthase subunit I [Acidimicrobiia bacterium]|nr:ATP synthase subunit I [Acidimicrobiia bacterium]
MGQAVVSRIDGPAVETTIARDMVRRGLWVAPALVAVFGLVWGVDGAISTAYGIALVMANFLLAAALLSWTARISLGLMMGAALFGYLIRLGLIFAAVWLVRDASWVAFVPLGITIIVTHLGLLLWEVRYVSASLAFPDLKPETKES